jgi:hypothetical protein
LKAVLIKPGEHLVPLFAHAQPDQGQGQVIGLYSPAEDPGEHVSSVRPGQLASGDLQFQPGEAVRLSEREADELADVV